MEGGHADYTPVTVRASTERDVNDIPDNVLLGRVLRSLASRRRGKVKVPLWSVVANQFALGSTYAEQLCRRFGLDPDQIVRI